ncbi:MAG: RNA methyltransferase [Dehalococcoidales bacterium]
MPVRSLKWYRQLADKNGRLETGLFLVEGEKAIRQIVDGHPDAITDILSVAEYPPLFSSYPTRIITASQFRYISSVQTPQGIMAVVKTPTDIYSPRLPKDTGRHILLLEDIQDPGNVGTLIRTAAALDYNGVILTESCADPLAPKCVQASAGTVLSVWLRRTEQYLEIVQSLKRDGYTLVAADVRGTDEPSILAGQKKLVLALGNEAAGLSKELSTIADHRVRIPTVKEKAESLNVAACGAILMYLSSS